MKKKFVTLLLLICGMVACSQVAFAAGGSASTPVDLGQVLPIWSCIPFAGLLLCIAICPLIKPEWWEKNQPIVIIFWSLLFLIPFGIAYGGHIALEHLLEVIIGDYLTFIVLLFGLFCVAGNIALEGDLAGTPKVNLVMLLIGTLLSSWVGTTGASMIMIRPLIRANQWRSHKVHVMVFFIFLVSNIGGCLTPVGDPPLLMGFMHGIPFFWTLRLAPVLLLNAAILLTVFFIIDHRDYKKDLFMGRTPVTSETKKPLHLAGAHNIIFLIVIVGAVILSGTLPSLDVFQTADGAVRGIPIYGDVTLTYPALIEVVIILAAAFLSFKTTKKEVRTENHFLLGCHPGGCRSLYRYLYYHDPGFADSESEGRWPGSGSALSDVLDHRFVIQLPGQYAYLSGIFDHSRYVGRYRRCRYYRWYDSYRNAGGYLLRCDLYGRQYLYRQRS